MTTAQCVDRRPHATGVLSQADTFQPHGRLTAAARAHRDDAAANETEETYMAISTEASSNSGDTVHHSPSRRERLLDSIGITVRSDAEIEDIKFDRVKMATTNTGWTEEYAIVTIRVPMGY